MIPRLLHYVWIGGRPLNPLGERCLASWQRHLPGWEIRRWDERNSPMEHPFVARMVRDKKFAFASDYIRLHALAQWGGLYLDTDMELMADISHLVDQAPCTLAFLSAQNRASKNSAAMGFLAAVPNHAWIMELGKSYRRLSKAVMNTTLATESLRRRGLAGLRNTPAHQAFWDIGDVRVYHSDFFYPPYGRETFHSRLAIHHAEGSWTGQATPLPWWRRLLDFRLDRKLLRPIEALLRKVRL